jgi:hypothetical protein
MKYNKLIAEFMGAEWHKDFFKDVCIISTSNISYKFDTSWDWLMPVVKKCRQENRLEYFDFVYYALEECDINVTYKAVVEFIKNKNN